MFIGREADLSLLSSLWEKRTASLITCRGRRRVGKSTLIEEFAARTSTHFIAIEGLPPRKGMTDAIQRKNFMERLGEWSGVSLETVRSWPLAFAALDAQIPKTERTVVLLDEISWMGGYDPDFPGFFKAAWDKKLKRHDNLVVVLCGSVSAWIADNVLDNTGFVGRDTLDLEVHELSPSDSIKLLGPTGERLSAKEKIDILSVVGGVPRYLEEIRPALSVDENIRRMAFMRQGLLFREFDDTFNAVFGSTVVNRRRLLEALVERHLTATEIAAMDGRKANGTLIRALRELCLAGFVERESGLNLRTGKAQKIDRYRIKDNYIRFYLRFVAPQADAIAKGAFAFSSLEQLGGWGPTLGRQFENLVLNHVTELLPLLGLDRSLVLSAAPYVQNATTRGKGCEIDLLIQTRRSVFVVEIKRRTEISASVMDEVAEKVGRLDLPRGLSVRTALVYEGYLSPQVEAERYFDFLVPAERLLFR